MKTVAGLGALNVDNFYRVENLLLFENLAKPLETYPGGSAANTIIALSKLGIRTKFIGVVADDDSGKIILKNFKKNRVNVQNVIIKKAKNPAHKTGSLDIYVDKNGRRAMFVRPNINSTLSLSDINSKVLQKVDYIHLSSFGDIKQLNLQKEIIKKLDKKIKVSFAPGAIYVGMGMKAIEPLLKRADLIFLNKQEIETLMGTNYRNAAKKLLKNFGDKILAITNGKAGSLVTDGKKTFEIKSSKIKTADTTGAGDAYVAGFLFGNINERNLEECATLGDATASFAIRKIGATTGLPNRKQLLSVVSFPK